MAGLTSGTQATQAVISGIVVVALVSGFSDAFSQYLSERTERKRAIKTIWKESAILFGTKFAVIIQFILPFIFLPLIDTDATVIDSTHFALFWGLFLISILSGYIARQQETRRIIRTMLLYVIAAIIIITITYYAGDFVAFIFSLFQG